MGYYLSRTICALVFAQAFVFGNSLFAQFLVPTNGPEGGLIYGIVEDSAGDIFIMSHGIYKLNPDGESWSQLEHQPGTYLEQITDLGIDSEGCLYAWDKPKMWKSNAEHTAWTRCSEFTGSPHYMSYGKEFVVDQFDRIIVIGDIYTGNEMETRPAVCWSDDRGDSWQIADTAGLYFYDDLRSLTVDESGLVWVSAYRYDSIDPNQGLYRSNSDLSEWTSISILGDQTRFVSGLFAGDGSVFANTTDGIFRYDLTSEDWTELAPVTQGDTLRILSVAQDHTVYSSQGDGIYFSEDNGESWTILSNSLAERSDILFESSDGNRFLGTKYDISRFSEETASWNPINSNFSCIIHK